MRTTLNLDEDVARRLTELALQGGNSMSRIANEVLRAGLRVMQQTPSLAPYQPPVFDTGRPMVVLVRHEELGP